MSLEHYLTPFVAVVSRVSIMACTSVLTCTCWRCDNLRFTGLQRPFNLCFDHAKIWDVIIAHHKRRDMFMLLNEAVESTPSVKYDLIEAMHIYIYII